MITVPHAKERNLSLDILRVIAIFMVIWQHSNEFYYIGDGGSLVKDAIPTVGIIDSFARACIGLFVMITGFLLLPMKQTTGQFFRRRFTRVLYPWIFWCIAFAVYLGIKNGGGIMQMLINVAHIPVNFGTEVGHLWYVYMLLGLYLIVPIISPWLRACSKRELQFYLAIWGITTLVPYLHLAWPAIWGECYWNPTPTLYYFNGFAGYLVLGHYIRRYGALNLGLSWILAIGGLVVTTVLFFVMAPNATTVAELEIPWSYCTLNVAVMVLGIFSLIARLHIPHGTSMVKRAVVSASVCSYAVYLCHIMILSEVHTITENFPLPIAAKVPIIAICTFLLSWFVVWLLAKLPKAKWWLGI